MTENRAAWLRKPGGMLEVADAPLPTPGTGEVAVRVHAVALNPVDAIPGIARRVILPWLRYPTVLGSDVAGEVIGVGAGVDRFRVGDRVLGHAVGQERSRNRAAEGAFQNVVILLEHMTAAIPDALSYEQAAVLPLALSTAACGLFEPDLLALELPTVEAPDRGESVLVWGAGTTVGMNAIQLARGAGYDVVATASPRSADLARELGARVVVDRSSPTVVTDLVESLRGRRLAGAVAIGAGSSVPCIAVARQVEGRRATASSMPGPASLVAGVRARVAGVRFGTIWGGTLKDDHVGPAIYRNFLPAALASGAYRAAPTATIVGTGLESFQPGLERLRAGVTGTKLVVTL